LTGGSNDIVAVKIQALLEGRCWNSAITVAKLVPLHRMTGEGCDSAMD